MDIRHKDRFFKTRGLRRLGYVDRLTAIGAILGTIASVGAVVAALLLKWNELAAPIHRLIELLQSLFGASKAHAAEIALAASPAHSPSLRAVAAPECGQVRAA